MSNRVRANLLYLSKVRGLVVKDGGRAGATWGVAFTRLLNHCDESSLSVCSLRVVQPRMECQMVDQEKRRLLHSSRQEGRSSDLFDDPSAGEHFVDGVGQMLIGPSVARLFFFRVVSTKDENGLLVEERLVSSKLVVPTPSLIQWAASVISSVLENKDAMNSANIAVVESMNQAVEAITKANKAVE